MAPAQFTFTTNNGALVITGYTGPGGTVTIPGTSNNLPVIIGDYAFYGQNTLTNLTLLNGIVDIGNDAFELSTNLTGVAIPGSVTNIDTYAFAFCQGLTNVVISNGVANIADYAFNATSIKSLIIPGSVTNIGPNAFGGCQWLPTVTISNGVQSIGEGAFSWCLRMYSVVIPASVTSIGPGVFQYSDGITNIGVDAANPNYASVGGVLFNKSLDTLVECPGHPNGYGNWSYVIPAGVTTIDPQAFALTPMTNVTVPDGVTEIGDFAFEDCNITPDVSIPASVTNIGSQAFASCYALSNIIVDPANLNYADEDGVLFDKNFDTLIQYPTGRAGNYVIPNSVSTIASNAFVGSKTTGVTIPDSVTNIGIWAFGYCNSLTNVTIPGSVRSIGSYAFWNCAYLSDVTMLSGVSNIDFRAFSACYYLSNIYCLGDAPTADPQAFLNVPGIVYYLPGTTGWTNTLAGLPTAAWYLSNPVILNNGAGMLTNGFGFTISWATNVSVVVEASTNLMNWQPVQTNPLVSGSAYFGDPEWTSYSRRFYRIRAQ